MRRGRGDVGWGGGLGGIGGEGDWGELVGMEAEMVGRKGVG